MNGFRFNRTFKVEMELGLGKIEDKLLKMVIQFAVDGITPGESAYSPSST